MNTAIRHFSRQAPATTWLIAACVGIFVVTAIQARSLTDSVWGSSLGTRFVLWRPFVQEETVGPLRALTAMFLHLDASHLVINMILLALIGREIEQFLGTRLYATTYIAGGLGGSAAVLWMDGATPTAGASGALYALMAVLVAVAYRRSTDLRAPLVLVVINVAYTFISPGVSLWGHLGGLIAGALMAWPVTSYNPQARWAVVLVVGALVAGACVAAGL